MKSVLEELSRRGVVHAAAVYVAAAWGGTEILAFLVGALWGDPAAAVASRYLAVLLIAGFPVAMYLAWTRDLGLHSRRVVGAAVLAIVLVAGLLWLVPEETNHPSEPSVAQSAVPAVAVLPLENLSGDPAQDYFAAGMTDAIIADLSRYPGIKVISRTSVMRYQGTRKSVQEIAEELAVTSIVEGSVQRAGQHVRITTTLIDATTDHHVWTETFERDIEDVLALQGEVARATARGVGANLSSEAVPTISSRRVEPAAYDAFLKARESHLDSSSDPDHTIGLYEKAIELDPTFAPAYAYLANLYGYLALVSNLPTGDAYLRAHQLAQRAIQIDPALPQAHLALARVHFQYEWDWAGADSEFERALALDPNSALALDLYGIYRILVYADCQGGLSSIAAAEQRDPLEPSIHFDRGAYAFHCRHWDESIEHLTRAAELEPSFHLPRLMLAWNYLQQGWTERAVDQCADVLQELGTLFDPIVTSTCAWLYGKAGLDDAARPLLERLRHPPESVRVDPSWLVGPCAALGDHECAIAQLEQAAKERSSNMVFLRVAVQWDDLRGDPRFDAIVQRMNFPH